MFVLDQTVAVPSTAEITVHHQMGSSAARTDYLPLRDALREGGSVAFGPALLKRGRPSDGAFPSFVVQGPSGGIALMIGWSGSWFATVSRNSTGVRIAVSTGRLSAVLSAGEEVRSGRVVALAFEGSDSRIGYNTLRRFIRAHVAPRDATGKPQGYFLSGNGFDRWPQKDGTSQRWHIDQLKKAGADACKALLP